MALVRPNVRLACTANVQYYTATDGNKKKRKVLSHGVVDGIVMFGGERVLEDLKMHFYSGKAAAETPLCNVYIRLVSRDDHCNINININIALYKHRITIIIILKNTCLVSAGNLSRVSLVRDSSSEIKFSCQLFIPCRHDKSRNSKV